VLNVNNIRVVSFDVDHLDIFWDIEPTYEDVCNYSFVIEKSYSQFGPYFDLTKEFRNKFMVRDNTLRSQHSFYGRTYYRVRVRNILTGDTTVFPNSGGGASQSAPPDLIALEIARIERLKLKEFKGRKVWLFPRKRFGQRCSCYDQVTKRKLRSGCVTCFDTGWVGGYDSPLETYAQVQDPPELNVKTQLFEGAVENAKGLFSNFPDLAEGWVLVEHENVRWRIGSSIDKINKARSTVRQIADLHRIPEGDIEYSLPMNLESAEDILATPIRNYYNPQSLETAHKFLELPISPKGIVLFSGLIPPPSLPAPPTPTTLNMAVTTKFYLATTNNILTVDPTESEIPADATVSDSGQFRVLHVLSVPAEENISVQSIFGVFKWSSKITGAGVGVTKWAVSSATETPGAVPSGAEIIISGDIAATTTKTTHTISGLIPNSALPSGPFNIILLGKPSSPGDSLAATIFDQTNLDITRLPTTS
jgi:hypothetical protein